MTRENAQKEGKKGKMYRKLIFDSISIEVTRRCNLNCPHCLRGDAQSVDIDPATIDALLDQTERIYNLSFTGGEPTLNVPMMAHTLNALQSRCIPLSSMSVITNGVLLSLEFAKTVRDFSQYISRTGQQITVLISKDQYHKGADPDAAFSFYQQELDGIAAVEFVAAGEKPLAIGRGRTLADAKKPPIMGSIPHKIETLEAGKPCGCREWRAWPTPHENEKIICCRLSLSALGDLTLCKSTDGEYTADDRQRDLVICNLSPDTKAEDRDIDSGIERYNNCFPPCREAEAKETAIQVAEYKNHPLRALEDIRWAYQLMQADPVAKTTLLTQYPNLEDQFNAVLGTLYIAECLCLPEEYLAAAMELRKITEF